MKEIERLLPFVNMLNAFRNVKRVVRANSEKRWENDVEHSYHLAMIAWYIITTENLPLRAEKAIKYALIHDLVEVYAGDTYLFSTDTAHVDSKKEREEEARLKLEKEFPEFGSLHEAILTYEKREDEESQFIYALDKIQPVLNIYLDKGRTWKEEKIDLSMIEKAKAEKVSLSPEVKKYYDQLIKLLKDKKGLFHQENGEK